MAISDMQLSISHPDEKSFLESWKPLLELSAESTTPSTVLIKGNTERAHAFAAEMISKLIVEFPNMPLFVIPATPPNAEGEIDKTTEVMEWLRDTANRGENPAEVSNETPIPLVYLSNVNDLYSETTLARMVRRARFLGVIVIAVAKNLEDTSPMYSNITGMFTHVVEV